MAHAKRLGYFACIRINKKRGERTKPHGIPMNSDYWQLSIYRADSIRNLIGTLKPRHREKIEREAIALSTWKGQNYADVVPRIRDLHSRINTERDQSVLDAKTAFEATHKVGI
jgi:hypothetical protein